jgi:hypothetical protein
LLQRAEIVRRHSLAGAQNRLDRARCFDGLRVRSLAICRRESDQNKRNGCG